MNHRFWVLVFSLLTVFLFIVPLSAQTWRTVEWSFSSDSGINQNIRLTGLSPSTTLFIPILPGIDWSQSVLNLGVWFSESLNPESSLSVFINEELVYSQNLQSMPITPGEPGTLRIPLNLFSPLPEEQMIKVEINPSLFISRNHCEDLAFGNLWMVILKDSSFQFNGPIQDLPSSVEEFLLFASPEIEIVLPGGEWEKEIPAAYIQLISFLNRYYSDRPRVIKTIHFDEMSQEEREDELRQRIYLRSPSLRDYHLLGNRLYLTPEGVDVLIQRYQKILIGQSGTVFQETLHPADTLPHLSFRNLGAGDLIFRGIGDMGGRVYFTAHDLGGIPELLRLHLLENSLKPAGVYGGEAFLKIWLNEQLVLTDRIPDEPTGPLARRIIELPSHLIERENLLEFIYSYFPDEGNCYAGAAPLEVFLSGDSYLERFGLRPFPEVLTLKDIPTALWRRGHIVLPDQVSDQHLKAAGQLSSVFWELNQSPLQIDVLHTNEGADLLLRSRNVFGGSGDSPFLNHTPLVFLWQELSQIPFRVRNQIRGLGMGVSGWQSGLTVTLTEYGRSINRILRSPFNFLFPTLEAIPRPHYYLFIEPDLALFPDELDILPSQEQLTLFSLPEGIPFLSVSPDEPAAVLAITRQQGKPAIFLSTIGRDDLALEYFFQHFQGIDTLRQVNGNLLLFTREGWTDLFIGEDLGWQPIPLSPWIGWYQRSQIPIFLVFFALLLAFCLYLYFRLARPGGR